MLELMLVILGAIVLFNFVNPGWCIGFFWGIIEFLLTIEWWQLILIIAAIALVKTVLKKLKK